MRTKIELIDEATVRITLVSGKIFDEFSVCRYSDGGAVRNLQGHQVCEFLDSRGNTLSSPGGKDLLDLIRKEWRRLRQALGSDGF